MLYASSKEALRKALVGIAAEIQGTDLSEVSYDTSMYFPMFCANTQSSRR